MAHRIQELTYGGLKPAYQARLDAMIEGTEKPNGAGRAKGMWMGGMPPLGYDVGDRKLVVNPAEAELVRLIFRRFLDLGSALLLSGS